MLLTKEEFDQIDESELYIGIVEPMLKNISEVEKLVYEIDMKERLAALQSVLVAENLSEDLESIREELISYYYQEYSFAIKHGPFYSSIIWQRKDQRYIDCVRNRFLDEGEVVKDFLFPLSFFFEKGALSTQYDPYQFSVNAWNIVVPYLEINERIQSVFDYIEDDYVRREETQAKNREKEVEETNDNVRNDLQKKFGTMQPKSYKKQL